uniref:Uncharacterized protein n=2 Tax=Clastoptera arizonana TaxID=38151 RepID=A0A1B6DTF8_9HEMI
MNQNKIFTYAYEGKIDFIKEQVSANSNLVTATDNNQRMLIHWASLGGHTELVSLLINYKSPIDPEDDNMMTPLILAASAGKMDVVRLLVSKNANMNAQTIEGHSSLQYAASKGWTIILEMLLDNGANVNICDKRGATPLHRASSRGNLPIVRLLTRNTRIQIDAKDSEGNTPLHLSCEEDHHDVSKCLVEHGARLDTLNKDSKTPLDYANITLARILSSINK